MADKVKVQNFSSDAEVAELVRAFEEKTISAPQFNHVAHIAVALSYLKDLPADVALQRMRENIRAFAAHHGVDNLYHETLTVFWMRLLNHLSATADVNLAFHQRVNRIVSKWGSRRPVDAHYTREVIASAAARERWIDPDRSPLPF